MIEFDPDRVPFIKLGLHIVQIVLAFVLWVLEIAVFTGKGSKVVGNNGWTFACFFISIPIWVYLIMTPRFERTRRFANVHAMFALDLFGVILWLSAFATQAAYNSSGLCGSRCGISKGVVALGVIITLLFAGSTFISGYTMTYFNFHGNLPGYSNRKIRGGSNDIDPDKEALDALAATLAQDFPTVQAARQLPGGRLDVAVNNAGAMGKTSLLHELPEESWDKTLALDLNSVFYCQKEELTVMLNQENLGPRRGRGVIINTASLYGLRAPVVPLYQTAYTAAKHAVVGLTKSDGIHYAPQGIRINASDKVVGFLLENSPIKRLVSPDEVADGIVFLASPMSSAMQASTLSLDLGINASS
ncbi:hypothetical protein NLG97_g8613 [Lecanicillium saksenae]|uniref:Uncharacterized protein n=1 Tax=Lecanicillium saksenae TaxID=468837 RepID=A0ACC1QKS2_9HYPO|nr:hypothetical protein NLG97_g8613 [Lecanicillium saksenae]